MRRGQDANTGYMNIKSKTTSYKLYLYYKRVKVKNNTSVLFKNPICLFRRSDK